MLEDIRSLPKQCLKGFELGKKIKVKKPKNILVCGMGGSGIPGDFLKEMNLDVPVVVNKKEKIPSFVSTNTLVFCVSYSGNTKETISCYKEAKKMGAPIVVVTSGGKLEKMVKNNLIKIPKGFEPRAAFGYLFFSILGVLQNSGIVDIEEQVKKIKKIDSKKIEERAKKITKSLKNKVPIIYSNSFPVSHRWKIGINENSKTLAYSEAIPEIFHNEVEGYEKINFGPFVLVLNIDYKIKKKFFKLLEEKEIPYKKIDFGSGLKEKIKALWLGDFLSYFLGKKYGVNVEKTEKIDWLKKD